MALATPKCNMIIEVRISNNLTRFNGIQTVLLCVYTHHLLLLNWVNAELSDRLLLLVNASNSSAVPISLDGATSLADGNF